MFYYYIIASFPKEVLIFIRYYILLCQLSITRYHFSTIHIVIIDKNRLKIL